MPVLSSMVSPGATWDKAEAKSFVVIVLEVIKEIPIKNRQREILDILLYIIYLIILVY